MCMVRQGRLYKEKQMRTSFWFE